MKLIVFERDEPDVLNKEGTKVVSHKIVNVCAPTIASAREKAKLGDEYEVIDIFILGEDWNIS